MNQTADMTKESIKPEAITTDEKPTILSKIVGASTAALAFLVTKRRVMNNALIAERDYVAGPKSGIAEEFGKTRKTILESYEKIVHRGDGALISVTDEVKDFMAKGLSAKTPNVDEKVLLNMEAQGKFGLRHMSPTTQLTTLAFSAGAAVVLGAIAYQGFKYITKSRFQPDEEMEKSFAKVVEKERLDHEMEKNGHSARV